MSTGCKVTNAKYMSCSAPHEIQKNLCLILMLELLVVPLLSQWGA